MQLFRAVFAIVPLVLLAGALLLLILTLLSGAITKFPISEFYYLEAAVTVPSIATTGSSTRWTNYNLCGVQDGRNANCGPKKAAYGFDPSNFADADPALPDQITSNASKSKITSKVYYSFLLIAAFFTAVAMFAAFAGCLGRKGALIGLVAALGAAATTAIAAALMTVVYVRARNNFRAGGIASSLGVKLFAFVWTAVAATTLAFTIFFVGAIIPDGESRGRRRKARSYQEKPLVTDNDSYHPVQPSTYTAPEPTSVYEENARSSYERANPRTSTAAPIDSTQATGATYLR